MTLAAVTIVALSGAFLASMLLIVAGMLRGRTAGRKQPERWPSVSVIVPAHDEQESLPATLASLRRQSYAGEIEFVIVDDRSTDGTAEVAASYASHDRRFRLVQVTEPGARLSPKVHAVDRGIRASRGEILLTTDADCVVPSGWVSAMVEHLGEGVDMVVGYVEARPRNDRRGLVAAFDAVDWFVLMLVSRSLARLGFALSSSANNQAYRRSAFERVRGFGAAGRAPSGDEDLFVQRVARLGGGAVVFADDPDVRVVTAAAESLHGILHQRRRWVSRFHHPVHYHPGFFAAIAVLGAHSVGVTAGLLALPFAPALAPWVLGAWGAVLATQILGLHLGTRDLGRRDLWGWPSLTWALLHPVFIAVVSLWSFVRPGDWRFAGGGYRRRLARRALERLRKRVHRSARGVGGW